MAGGGVSVTGGHGEHHLGRSPRYSNPESGEYARMRAKGEGVTKNAFCPSYALFAVKYIDVFHSDCTLCGGLGPWEGGLASRIGYSSVGSGHRVERVGTRYVHRQ